MRIVYVEDGDFRLTFGPSLRNGLKKDGVEIAIRKTLEESIEELQKGDLADVYILDNEIIPSDVTGAEFALMVKEKARELGKEVLVISLLCSNPEEVKKEYGGQFEAQGIPVLSKNFHAAFCAFFVGACIQEGKPLNIDEWLNREGIKLPDSSSIQDQLMAHIEFNEHPGGYYLTIREYVEKYRDELTKFMRPEAIRELNRNFPQEMHNGIERE